MSVIIPSSHYGRYCLSVLGATVSAGEPSGIASLFSLIFSFFLVHHPHAVLAFFPLSRGVDGRRFSFLLGFGVESVHARFKPPSISGVNL